MKKMKRWGLRRLGGKRGFTLIELLIVMVILAILAGIVIISVGGVIGRGQETAYNGAKEQVEAAVTDYIARTFGDLPTTGGNESGPITLKDTSSMAGPFQVIDICVLLATCNVTPPGPGILKEVPVSAWNGTNDNCDGTVFTCSCRDDAHYKWLLGPDDDVYSICKDLTGSPCDNADTYDGFQGTYP